MNSRLASRVPFSLFFSVVLCAATFCPYAFGVPYYVSDSSGSDASNGTSWGAAKKTIQAAVNVATNGGDVINVTNGTYTVTTQIWITNSLTLQSVNGPLVTTIKGNGASSRLIFIGIGQDPTPTNGAGTVVDGFTLTGGYATGGNEWANGGAIISTVDCTIQNCRILNNNSASYHGGGVASRRGTQILRNCVVAGNRAANTGGGVYANQPTTNIIDNCTIINNYAANNTGGVHNDGGSRSFVRNSIVYNNYQGTPAVLVNYSGGSTFSNSCTYGMPAGGSGNITNFPSFTFIGDNYGLTSTNGDYHLRPSASCIDTGLVLSLATDLEGQVRNKDGNGDGVNAWDVGAYESFERTNGSLRFDFVASKASGLAPCDVIFTLTSLAGANTNALGYIWDFGNGVTNTGAGLSMVTNTYAAGAYVPRLTLTNDTGETVTLRLQQPATTILVGPSTVYVATNGLHQSPFDTWAKAATNIQAAVDAAGVDGTNFSTVLLSNGVYALATQVTVAKGITVRSLNGPAVTIVKALGGAAAVNNRGFYINAAGAVVDGLTITNGYISSVTGGTDNGGGVRMDAGTIQNCIMVGNRASGNSGDASIYGGGGLGLHAGGGTVRNCLIAANHVNELGSDSAGGGGIWVNGPWRIENCTIVRNFAGGHASRGGGGGILRTGGAVTVTNCIVYYNTVTRSGSTGTAWA